MGADDSLPDDVTALKAMLRAERAARLAAEAEAKARTLLIEKLKLTIRKLRHEQFGQSSERGALLDQLELQLADRRRTRRKPRLRRRWPQPARFGGAIRTLRIPEKATTLSGAWRPCDPVDDDQGGARA